MPRRREPLQVPRNYVTEGTWPNGVIEPGAPAAVHYLAAIVRDARAALAEEGITQYELATMANLDRSTIRLVLNGYKWPDMVTIVKMEQVLGVRLWPAYGDEIFKS